MVVQKVCKQENDTAMRQILTVFHIETVTLKKCRVLHTATKTDTKFGGL